MKTSKTKVGVVPYSSDLQHPADRRRIKVISDVAGIQLQIKDLIDLDVLILSNASNFHKYINKAKCPIIIDLVDAYLAERPGFFRDFIRNLLRTMNGTSSLRFLRYTSHLKYACERADAVIVATVEQSRFIEGLNKNVHIIVDDQSEMINIAGENQCNDGLEKKYIFWEGLGYTIKHFDSIAGELEALLIANDFHLQLLTNLKFHRWGGFLGTIHTEKLIRKVFPKAWKNIHIIPWSVAATKKAATSSMFGIIPISKNDHFAMFKPENKLISMWAMGLPVLCTPTPAYKRVAADINVPEILCDEDWTKKLLWLASNPQARRNLAIEGKNYYNAICTKEILQVKWLEAIESVLVR